MHAWDDLRFLLALKRAGSLAKAARQLNVDKATVGRRLTALEKALGVQILERLPGGYELTSGAERVLETAVRVEALMLELDRTLGERNRKDRVPVRVTAPHWFSRAIIIPALADFQSRNDAIELRLLTTNAVLNLAQREADVAIRNLKPRQRSLVAKRAGQLGSAVYATRTYLERRGQPTSRSDLSRHHFVAYEDRLTYLPGFQWLEALKPPIALRASDTLALCDGARAGVGLAVLPCYLGDLDPVLERIELAGCEHEEIWIITLPDLRSSPTVRPVIAWLAALFAANARRLGGEPR